MSEINPVDELQNKVDNYVQTVGAIIALGHLFKHDYGGEYKIAPKFHTSLQNRIEKSRDIDITPDIAGQTSTISIIGEVKKGFPANQDHWEDDIEQLEKYDDILTGWPSRQTTDHDIVVLTHYFMSGKLRRYVEKRIADGDLKFIRPFVILEFIRSRDREEYWSLKKTFGHLSDKAFDEKLEDPVGVPGDDIVPELSSVKFYDHEPPVVYTMSLLWDFVFSKKGTPEKFREAEGRKTIELLFSIDEAHLELKTFYGPPNSSIPRRQWVTNAFKAFERIGLATKTGDKFMITYHQIPEKQSLKFFSEQWIEKEQMQRKITDVIPEAKDVSKN